MFDYRRLLIFACLTLAVAPTPSPAQNFTVAAAPSAPAFLAPVGDPGEINSPTLFVPTEAAAGEESGVVKADLDFLFLQPIFPSRAVRLSVPAPAGSVIAATENLSNDFSFSPSFQLGYQFQQSAFGLQLSGRMLHLTGQLERTIGDTQGGVLAQATVNSTVDIAVLTPIEGFVNFGLPDHLQCDHPYLNDSLFTATVGGRYAHLQQNYKTTVTTQPGSQGTLTGIQTFNGFGVTSSVAGLYPLAEKWAGYSNARGSILIGQNERETDIGIVSPGLNMARKVRELNTDLFPVGELEMGLMYGTPLARAGSNPSSAPLLWFKGGFVGQAWGNLGLLNINEVGNAQFSGSNLILVGFNVQIGLQY